MAGKVGSMNRLLVDTAKLLRVSPRMLFTLAAESRRCNDAQWVGEKRYAEYMRTGRIPPYVENWMLDQWQPKEVANGSHRAHEAAT